MVENYNNLFTPWKIGNVEIKNRIVLCPMGGTSIFGWMEPNHFDKDAANFLMTVAKNNCGLVIPGIAPVRDLILRKWLYKGHKKFEELKAFMEEFHKTGAKMFIQLTAGFGRSFAISDALKPLAQNKVLGTIAKPIMDASYLCAAPSELPNRWAEDLTCRPITVKEIHEIIDAFGKTAKLLKEAGVDGVEVHAVHEGYLLDQFTLPYTNHRTDEYGGSFENRYRFAVEIVKTIKKACGEDFPVSLRYSVTSKTKGFCKGALPEEKDFVEVGRTMEESEKAVKYLEEAGYDMLNADNGTYDAWYWAHPPVYMPQNCNLEDVAHIKKFINIPVVCAGKMTLDVANEAIGEGRIDAMGVARQFLVDPEWFTKVIDDKQEEIKPCIGCHNGCFGFAKYKGSANVLDMGDMLHNARCALNPQTMNNHKYDIKKAKKVKNIAIIGAGVAGLEAAFVLTLRGHKVKVYEKTSRICGVFNEAANFDFKEKDKQLLKWYENMVKKLSIEIEFNKTIKNLEEIEADEYIIATGSKPRKLKISGEGNIIDALTYLNNKDLAKGEVVVVGGGLTGSEIAYELENEHKKVSIVEITDDLIKTKAPLANTSYLRDYFELHKTPVYYESSAKELKDGKLIVNTKEGEKEINCDTLIYCVGYNSDPLVEPKRHVHVVGDAGKVGNLRTAIWSAWDIATKI